MEASAAELAWLIGDAEPSPGVLHEARQAAVAWDSMKTWLAVCWESAVTVMCAMHALRILNGQPDPWTELENARLAAKGINPESTAILAEPTEMSQSFQVAGIDTANDAGISLAQLSEQHNGASVKEVTPHSLQTGDASSGQASTLEAECAAGSVTNVCSAQQTRDGVPLPSTGIPDTFGTPTTQEAAAGSIIQTVLNMPTALQSVQNQTSDKQHADPNAVDSDQHSAAQGHSSHTVPYAAASQTPLVTDGDNSHQSYAHEHSKGASEQGPGGSIAAATDAAQGAQSIQLETSSSHPSAKASWPTEGSIQGANRPTHETDKASALARGNTPNSQLLSTSHQNSNGSQQSAVHALAVPATMGDVDGQMSAGGTSNNPPAHLLQDTLHNSTQQSISQDSHAPFVNTDAAVLQQPTPGAQATIPGSHAIQGGNVQEYNLQQQPLHLGGAPNADHIYNNYAALMGHHQAGYSPVGAASSLNALQHSKQQADSTSLSQQCLSGHTAEASMMVLHPAQTSVGPLGTSGALVMTGTSTQAASTGLALGFQAATPVTRVLDSSQAASQNLNGSQDQQILSNTGTAAGPAHMSTSIPLAGSNTAAANQCNTSSNNAQGKDVEEASRTLNVMHLHDCSMTASPTHMSSPNGQPYSGPAQANGTDHSACYDMGSGNADMVPGQSTTHIPLTEQRSPATPLALLLQQHHASNNQAGQGHESQSQQTSSMVPAGAGLAMGDTGKYINCANGQIAGFHNGATAVGSSLSLSTQQSAGQEIARQLNVPNRMWLGDEQNPLQSPDARNSQQSQLSDDKLQSSILTRSSVTRDALVGFTSAAAALQPVRSQQGPAHPVSCSQIQILQGNCAAGGLEQTALVQRRTAHSAGEQAAFLTQSSVPQHSYKSAAGVTSAVDSLQHSKQEAGHTLLTGQSMIGDRTAGSSIEQYVPQPLEAFGVRNGDESLNTTSALTPSVMEVMASCETTPDTIRQGLSTDRGHPSSRYVDNRGLSPNNMHVVNSAGAIENRGLAATSSQDTNTAVTAGVQPVTNINNTAGILPVVIQDQNLGPGQHNHSNASAPGVADVSGQGIAASQDGLAMGMESRQMQLLSDSSSQQAQVVDGSKSARIVTSISQPNTMPSSNTVEAADSAHNPTAPHGAPHTDDKQGITSHVQGSEIGLAPSHISHKFGSADVGTSTAVSNSCDTELPQSASNQQTLENALPGVHHPQGSGSPVMSQEGGMLMQQCNAQYVAHANGQSTNTDNRADGSSMSQHVHVDASIHASSQQLQGTGMQQANGIPETAHDKHTGPGMPGNLIHPATCTTATGNSSADFCADGTGGQVTAVPANAGATESGMQPTHLHQSFVLSPEEAKQTDDTSTATQGAGLPSDIVTADYNTSASSGLAGHGPDSSQPHEQREDIESSHILPQHATGGDKALSPLAQKQGDSIQVTNQATVSPSPSAPDSQPPGTSQPPAFSQATGYVTQGLVLYSTSKPFIDRSEIPPAARLTTRPAGMTAVNGVTAEQDAVKTSITHNNQQAACMDGTIEVVSGSSATSTVDAALSRPAGCVGNNSNDSARHDGFNIHNASVTCETADSMEVQQANKEHWQLQQQQLMTAGKGQTQPNHGIQGMTQAGMTAEENAKGGNAFSGLHAIGSTQQEVTATMYTGANAGHVACTTSTYSTAGIQGESKDVIPNHDDHSLQQPQHQSGTVPSQVASMHQTFPVHPQQDLCGQVYSNGARQHSNTGGDHARQQGLLAGQPGAQQAQQQGQQHGAPAGLHATGSCGLHDGEARQRPCSEPVISHHQHTAASEAAFWNEFQANPGTTNGNAGGARLRGCVAVERLKDRLLDALLALRLHQLVPSRQSHSNARSSLRSQQSQRGSRPEVAQGPVAKAIYSAVVYNNGLISLKQFQTLLGSQGCAVALTEQDMKDLQSLDILTTNDTASYLDLKRLCTEIRVDGPEYSLLATNLSPRLLRMLLSAVPMIQSHAQAPKYMHWVQFEAMMSHYGRTLRPVDWSKLQPYLMVTTKQHQLNEGMLPHTTYVMYAKLLADINGPGALRATPWPDTSNQSFAQSSNHDEWRPSTSIPVANRSRLGEELDDSTVAPLRIGDMSLDEKIKRLVKRSHGRSLVPPSNQEWGTVLTQLDRAIGKAHQSSSLKERTTMVPVPVDSIAHKQVAAGRPALQRNVSLPAIGVPKSKESQRS